MPKIIQEDKRVTALNEIEASLAVIRSINAALVEENSYIVTAVCSDARITGKVPIDEKDMPKLRSILAGQRARLAKDVLAKSGRHRIELDDDDMMCLEGKATGRKRRADKKSENEFQSKPTESQFDSE